LIGLTGITIARGRFQRTRNAIDHAEMLTAMERLNKAEFGS